jgi:hypothetical protein
LQDVLDVLFTFAGWDFGQEDVQVLDRADSDFCLGVIQKLVEDLNKLRVSDFWAKKTGNFMDGASE